MIDNDLQQEQVVQEEVVETTPTGLEPEFQAQPEQAKPAPSLENNMRALREKADRISRERDEALARLQEVELRAQQNRQPEEDLDFSLGADELAEGKHVAKMQKKTKKQFDDLAAQQEETRALLIELKLRQEFPDIEKVLTKEKMQELKETEPDLARSLESNKDYYSKARSAYKMIKKFGIYTEDNNEQEREAVQRNAAKPRPLSSISPQQAESPLSRVNAFANGLTPELKAQLYKEMEESIKNM